MIEVQNIFTVFGEKYRQTHKLSLVQHKAMNAIMNCRTERLGGHMDVCPSCGFTKNSYNSCRNRHCPKCQTLAKEKWIDNQKYDLLNVGYFHVVFTIPDNLNKLIYFNQKDMYNLLFRAVAETLQELSSDKKYLDATIGFTSVLHTWGQNLMFHPHIHCIVPAGGLTKDFKWRASRKKFFLPVKVLSRKFKGKFLSLLKDMNLDFPKINSIISDSYAKEWVVYCKPPFKTAACVVEYLGRYTHRVAISNNRILKLENDTVYFKWRDYKDSNAWKVMTISAEEFIRRFLMHVLPQRFMKIRHYGILGNRNKTKKLSLCKKLTNTVLKVKEKASSLELIKRITGKDICKCPACGEARLTVYSVLYPLLCYIEYILIIACFGEGEAIPILA